MKTKIQIKSVLGKVLFEFEKEDNTIKDTVLEAIKSRSDLSWSDLRGSDLRGSNLSGSNLSWSDLRGSDLRGSNLSWSNLSGSNLSWSDLRGSNLRGSDLSGSNLSGSDLRGSDLSWSDLRGSDLRGSNLSGSKNIPEIAIAQTRILPEGDLIGWKKCMDGVIVKLLIPAKAKRSNAFGRKCRASYVKTLEVIGAKVGVGSYGEKTKYIKGKITKADKWDDDYTNECSNGIHFFITRLEAEQY